MQTKSVIRLRDTERTYDFAAVEGRGHEADRKVARLLCKQTAPTVAESVEQPPPCPGCGQCCFGEIKTRQFGMRAGPIEPKEARLDNPRWPSGVFGTNSAAKC